MQLVRGANGNGVIFGFRQSSDGKLAISRYLYLTSNNLMNLTSEKFTSATAFSASYSTEAILTYNPIWVKVADNNTNRILSISPDGINWRDFHSVGRTDFLTADQIVFGVSTLSATEVNASLLSYEAL
jgi:hypothetical protein